MIAYAIIAACLLIFLNLVPRINDMHGHVSWTDKRSVVRFLGLCFTGLACLWVSLTIVTPMHAGQDYALLMLLLGVAATWSTSPSIGKNWLDYLFKSGECNYKRRASDKIPPSKL